MSEDSTPSNETTNETLPVEPVSCTDTSDIGKPEVDTAEADDTEPMAEESGKKLLAGKFKTVAELEKSYKEAETYIYKAKELEKRVSALQEAENEHLVNLEIQARKQGFQSHMEKQTINAVKNYELNCFREALESGSVSDYQAAEQALRRFEETQDEKDFKAAKRFFDPDVLATIARQTFVFAEHKNRELAEKQKIMQLQQIKERWETAVRQDPEWFEKHAGDTVLAEAVASLGENLDWNRLKTVIDEVEKKAVDSYLRSQSALAENNAQKQQLQLPKSGNTAEKSGNGWITRSEYNAMSDKETYEKYDQIVRQIQLEKEGKLPRMLT